MRYTPSGQSITSFSVASTHRYTTGAGDRKEETTWFNCSCFGKLAEITNQYLTKGQQVYLEGRVSLRTYDKRDGSLGASLDVNVSSVQFLGQKAGGNDAVAAGAMAGHHVPDDDAPDDVDDLPF